MDYRVVTASMSKPKPPFSRTYSTVEYNNTQSYQDYGAIDVTIIPLHFSLQSLGFDDFTLGVLRGCTCSPKSCHIVKCVNSTQPLSL